MLTSVTELPGRSQGQDHKPGWKEMSAVPGSSSGRVFHAVGPATENDLTQNPVRVRGTSYNPDAAERRCERPGSSVTEVNNTDVNRGAAPCTEAYKNMKTPLIWVQCSYSQLSIEMSVIEFGRPMPRTAKYKLYSHSIYVFPTYTF